MTSQMRASYEMFGNFISIDAMKRQQNSLHWPYIGPCIYDENKTVAVIAESIVCAKRHKAYKFVLDSISVHGDTNFGLQDSWKLPIMSPSWFPPYMPILLLPIMFPVYIPMLFHRKVGVS